jgi:hypothetical protein
MSQQLSRGERICNTSVALQRDCSLADDAPERAAADAEFTVAQQNALRGAHDGVRTGRAEPVNRHRHRLHRRSRLNGRHPRHIGEPSLSGDGIANGDVMDCLWIDTGAQDCVLTIPAKSAGSSSAN